jgi:ketosteroid isomerase-like protein
MTKFLLIIISALIFSCTGSDRQHEATTVDSKVIDIAHELDLIEQTRSSFQAAFNEKRFGDLNQFIMKGFKGVPPGSEDWMEYNRLGQNPAGQFSVDSISMSPLETAVVSDSVAYDFGTSSLYYKNAEGKPIELKNTFLMILKKDKNDGVWKLYRDVSSSVVE